MGMSHGDSNMILGPKDNVQNGKNTIHQDQNIMHKNYADYILQFQRDTSQGICARRTDCQKWVLPRVIEIFVDKNHVCEGIFGKFWLPAFARQCACSHGVQCKVISGQKMDCGGQFTLLICQSGVSRHFLFPK
jgi:hypothetical protein